MKKIEGLKKLIIQTFCWHSIAKDIQGREIPHLTPTCRWSENDYRTEKLEFDGCAFGLRRFSRVQCIKCGKVFGQRVY